MPSHAYNIANLARGRGRELLPMGKNKFIIMQRNAADAYAEKLPANATNEMFLTHLKNTELIHELALSIDTTLQNTVEARKEISLANCSLQLLKLANDARYKLILEKLKITFNPTFNLIDPDAFAKLLTIGHAADTALQTYFKSRHAVFMHRGYATDLNTREHDAEDKTQFGNTSRVFAGRVLPKPIRSLRFIPYNPVNDKRPRDQEGKNRLRGRSEKQK